MDIYIKIRIPEEKVFI